MILAASYPSAEAFRADIDATEAYMRSTEDVLRLQSAVPGYCVACERLEVFTVDAGPDFGPGYPNLREGLVCPCGAKNRDRLMILASRSEILVAQRVIFFGALSGWASWARCHHGDRIQFCEYLEDASSRGQDVVTNGVTVRNEDLTSMTFDDEVADLIVHQDVLEHIPDYRASFRETYRVLKLGGQTIFTAPFFHERIETFVRASLRPDGSLEHFAPEERHGDPLSPDGILAFYNFGWSLLDEIRAAGFIEVTINMIYSGDMGLVSTGCPVSESNMMPVYISAKKAP